MRTNEWGDGAAIHVEEKITNFLKQHLGSHNHELLLLSLSRLMAIQIFIPCRQ